MQQTTEFSDVLETASNLPLDEQEMLVDILRNRLIENKRRQLKADVAEARREFERGLCKPMTTEEIMQEVLS